MKYILLANHNPTNHNDADAVVVHLVEAIGQMQEQAKKQNEQHDEFFKGHEGSQRHDGNAER